MKMFLLLMLLASPALSHQTVPGHSCEKPSGSKGTSRMDGEIFQVKLAIYESCMFDYIRNQQREADVHEQAAAAALDEWNEFIQSELE